MSAASGSVSPAATQNVAGIQAYSVGCTSARCVITGTNQAGIKAKTALLNPATGAVRVTSSTLAAAVGFKVGCPDKATCLGIGYLAKTEAITAVSTQTGAESVTAKLPTADQYNLFNIACPSSKYCWVDGSSAAPGVKIPTWGLLLKVSSAGKILQRTVDKTYEQYAPVTCETSTTCLIGRETTKFKYQSMVLVNGKFGHPYAYPANLLPFDATCYSNKVCYGIGVTEGSVSHLELVPLNPKTGAPGTPVRLPFSTSTGVGIAEAIACYSATQCVAVGGITAGSGASQTTEAAYVLISKGKVSKPVVASKNLASFFDAVACASPQECYAVGQYYDPGIQASASIVGKV